MSNLRIELAADHLDLVPTVAGWHWDHGGGEDPEGSRETWTQGLLTRTNRDRVPATFFAFEGSQLVGSATLVDHDMPDRADLKHLRPWLAGVYVTPAARGRGRLGARFARGISRSLIWHRASLSVHPRGGRFLRATRLANTCTGRL